MSTPKTKQLGARVDNAMEGASTRYGRALVVATALLLVTIMGAHASIIGGYPCLIACGRGGGIVNKNFAGEVFYSGVAEETVSKGEEKLNGVLKERADDFLQKFDTKVTAQREELLKQFDSTLTKQREEAGKQLAQLEGDFVQELRDLANEKIKAFGESLQKDVERGSRELEEALEIGGVRLTRNLIYVAGLVAVLALFVAVYVKNRPTVQQKIGSFTAGAGLILAISYGGYALIRNVQLSDLRQRAEAAAARGDYRELYTAGAIIQKVLSQGDAEAQSFIAAGNLAFELAWLPLDRNSQEGLVQIGKLLDEAAEAQAKLLSGKAKRNPVLDAWLATLLWHFADDRRGEYVSANFAATAITGLLALRHRTRGDAVPLGFATAMAALDGYLDAPLEKFSTSPTTWDQTFQEANKTQSNSWIALLPPPRSNGQLRAVFEDGAKILQGGSGADKELRKKQRLRKLKREVSEVFARTVALSVEFTRTGNWDISKDLRQKANQAVEHAHGLWEDAEGDLKDAASPVFGPIEEQVGELLAVPLELVHLGNVVPTCRGCWVAYPPTIPGANPLIPMIEDAIRDGNLSEKRGRALIATVSRVVNERVKRYQSFLDAVRYATLPKGQWASARKLLFRHWPTVHCGPDTADSLLATIMRRDKPHITGSEYPRMDACPHLTYKSPEGEELPCVCTWVHQPIFEDRSDEERACQ